MKTTFIIQESESAQRIDSLLTKKFPDYSRSFFGNLIKSGHVLINEKEVKPALLVKAGDRIDINFTEPESNETPQAEEIPLKIIYEDDNVLIIDKEPGIVVHPAAGNKTGTLVNALLHYFPALEESVYSPDNPVSRNRPGLVHRLDKDTSGLLIIAKNTKSMISISRQINNRSVEKIYYALCYGWPRNPEGKLVNYLGRHPKNRKIMADVGPEKGREAISFYQVLKYYEDRNGDKISLIRFDIKTGRTHQIRVQSSLIGNPVIGDSTYGNKLSIKISSFLGAKRQLLHAKEVEFFLPGESRKTRFYSNLPDDFLSVVDRLSEAKSY